MSPKRKKGCGEKLMPEGGGERTLSWVSTGRNNGSFARKGGKSRKKEEKALLRHEKLKGITAIRLQEAGKPGEGGCENLWKMPKKTLPRRQSQYRQ